MCAVPADCVICACQMAGKLEPLPRPPSGPRAQSRTPSSVSGRQCGTASVRSAARPSQGCAPVTPPGDCVPTSCGLGDRVGPGQDHVVVCTSASGSSGVPFDGLEAVLESINVAVDRDNLAMVRSRSRIAVVMGQGLDAEDLAPSPPRKPSAPGSPVRPASARTERRLLQKLTVRPRSSGFSPRSCHW